MTLRPAAANWFELLTSREELSAVLCCLAETGQVQLQSRSDVSAAHLLPALRVIADEHRRLAQRYGEYWPAPAPRTRARELAPEEVATAALQHVRDWAAAADESIVRLQGLADETTQLHLLHALVSQPDVQLPDLAALAGVGPVLAGRVYLLPSQTPGAGQTLASGPSVLLQRVACGERTYVVAIGPPDQIAALDDALNAMKAQRVTLLPDLPAGRAAAAAALEARLAALAEKSRSLEAELQALHARYELGAALADLQFVEWLVAHVPELAVTEHFAWVTGWTSDLSGTRIEAALERAGLQYLLRYPGAPAELIRPVVLSNPAWARPFEMFARLLGMPGASETDPSRILAIVAPLMFGYMFGDVGHGAVLIVAGLALRKRYPAMALLISGGFAAMLFGFAFGCVFTNEQLIAPLWLRPIEHPLPLLIASLGFGVLVIALGLTLDAVQYHWSGRAAQWWGARAGLAACYVGMVGAVLDLRLLWLLPLGLGWYWGGSALLAAEHRSAQLTHAIGESIETLLQLAVNTVSFVRVGAFALAHAGLSTVIAELALDIESPPLAWLVLLLGNVLIVVIEGLVVGIQTTRLVLFEFFIRFLQGSGRPFLPLPAPAAPLTTAAPRKSP